MIELKNVSFHYSGSDEGRLKNINLTIKEGECVLFCGPSGCGKTTTLRLINGLIPDYFDGELQGEILKDGESIADMEMYERSRFVGSLFQNPRTQFFNVDTDSEIAFGMENMKFPRQFMKKRMDETIKRLRLEELRGRSIFELSGGEKQRIAFASIYAMNPEIFLLDEPSSNLDEKSIEELKAELKCIKEEGKTILISEHRLYYLMDLADRIVYMREGQIEKIFSTQEFKSLSEEERLALGLRAMEKPRLNVKEPELNVEEKGFALENLTIKMGKTIIQEGLNFVARPGDIVGIIGENGAGKTTLSRTLCGLNKDCQGTLEKEGQSLKRKDLQALSYMVMQDVNYQLFAASVEKECLLGMQQVTKEQVKEILSALGLYEYRHRHPARLSGGQKQRLAVAVSCACNKKLLVFDEPTSGLDYESMQKVTAIIKELAKDRYVFVVTHDVEFMNLVCNRVLKLEKRRKDI